MRQKYVTCPQTGKIYPIPAGGSADDPPADDPPADDPPADDPPPDDPDDDEPLGDAGKKALERERRARREAEKRAKRAEELEQELEQFREQQMSEQEKAIEQAKREAAEKTREEILGEVTREKLETRLVRAATGKLANPELVTRLIDTDDLDPDDAEAISAAVDRLLEQEPYLAASATQPVGDGGGGPKPDREEPDPSEMDMDTYREWRKSKRRAS